MKFFLVTLFLITTLFAADKHEEKKLVMLFVTLEHCTWCKKMEKEVFLDSEVNATLQKQFTIKKVLYGKDVLPNFIKPKHFPTTYVLSLDETKVIDSLVGYREKKKFLKFFEGTYRYEMEGDDAL
jgi:thioredoxin-related protein